jgi:RNA polymerase sigma-70 factor (ECF subfamily)
VVQLYDALAALTGSPVVALNRAVAVAEAGEPEAALAIVDGLALDGYR